MADLWKLPNIHALPTASEIKLAKESIEILELQLQNAVARPRPAQDAVASLQRQIDERRSWIAPIRRIPHDVLFMIFVELCQMDWSAPLVLRHVSHGWRESILASPRTWSYFQLKEFQSYKLRSLFISRSAPCHLHLRLSTPLDSETSRLLASVTERIKCLNMNITHVSLLQNNRFPALERLRVFGDGFTTPSDIEPGFILNSDLFPRLKLLEPHTSLLRITWRAPPFSHFVALQAFSITGTDPQVWSMIVENCRESLISLSVRLYEIETSILHRKVILLPRLKYLSIENHGSSPIPWVIDARTPALQAYSETLWKHGLVGPIHEDTKTVISLRVRGYIELSKFPQLRQMNFSTGLLHYMVEQLLDSPEICPNLEIIVDDQWFSESTLIPAKELLGARNRQTGGNIQFGRGRSDSVFTYYGSIPDNCGYDMPCAVFMRSGFSFTCL